MGNRIIIHRNGIHSCIRYKEIDGRKVEIRFGIMKIFFYQEKVYVYFQPSPMECLEMFPIVEKPITPEEAERCRKLLKEWKQKERLKAMSEIFELITEYASEHYYDKFGFNNGEVADLKDEIIKLQDKYADGTYRRAERRYKQPFEVTYRNM